MDFSLVGASGDKYAEYEEVKEVKIKKSVFSLGKKTKTNEEIIESIWINDQLNDHIRNDLFRLWSSDYQISDKDRGRLWLVGTGALK